MSAFVVKYYVVYLYGEDGLLTKFDRFRSRHLAVQCAFNWLDLDDTYYAEIYLERVSYDRV